MGGDATKIYRAFKNSDHHLAQDGNHKRLKSSWFSSRNGVSVELGEHSSPLETYERHKPCGVAAVPLSKLAEHGLAPEIDPEDSPEERKANPGHRIVKVKNDRAIRDITRSAEIVIAHSEVVVVGANGTVGDHALQPPEPMPTSPPVQSTLFAPAVGTRRSDVDPGEEEQSE